MNQYMKANRRKWDELVAIHVGPSSRYGLEKFRAGGSTLGSIELEEVGDVRGKSLLHLQCHFGLDSMSWARQGARVTAVDYSEAAIGQARIRNEQAGLDVRFVCSNVYDVDSVLDEEFDVVFTSYGVLCWLPDLTRWAQIVARHLKPGGCFYIAEIHPVSTALETNSGFEGLHFACSYFHSPKPERFDDQGSYADRSARLENTTTYEWAHSLADILCSLIDAGLRIEFLHEFPMTCYQHFPFLEQGEDGWWRMPEHRDRLPLLFSLKATKSE
jgi:2-polyprenyl-3-methyl-5-hydroxy-6-metoxy-1,4-benzoquinol methylase